MRLALLGHGAMGQLVERLAREAGDEVATVLGSRESAFSSEELAEILGLVRSRTRGAARVVGVVGLSSIVVGRPG